MQGKKMSGLLKGRPVLGPLMSGKMEINRDRSREKEKKEQKKIKETQEELDSQAKENINKEGNVDENAQIEGEKRLDSIENQKENSETKDQIEEKTTEEEDIVNRIDAEIRALLKDTKKTNAEKAHSLLKKKRILKQLESKVSLTYRQKIDLLNKHLNELPINFDIPRVGPG